MEKKVTSPVVIGLVIALALIVLSLVLYFTGLFTESWTQYIGLVILVAGIIWAVINHGKERDNTASFGNLFAFGFKVTAVVTVLVILFTVLSTYIFPDMKTRIIEMSRQQQLSAPGANETQVEQGMAFFEKNYTIFIVIIILFWYLILGVVCSLIAAAVTKKRPSTPFEKV